MIPYIPQYVDALSREMELVLERSPETIQVHTIFFGGGTPSLLKVDQFARVFKAIRDHASLAPNAEITLEANPETVSQQSLQDLREISFNRISIGMQSASPQDLKVLDRKHDIESVRRAVEWSRQAGFDHINLDLIFGIPGQTLESWLNSLRIALKTQVDHFSVYSLILEEGTRLKKWVDRGVVDEPDEDFAADMYEATMSVMENSGYEQYEISNWARGEGSRCRHNLQYWRYLPYLGFGAGAHGFWGNIRTENVSLIPQYIDRIDKKKDMQFPAGLACLQADQLSKWEMIQENLMVSLRLTGEGVSLPEINAHYGVSVFDLFSPQIEKLLRLDLVELLENNTRMRVTHKGRLFGNRVFREFIGNRVPKGFEFLED